MTSQPSKYDRYSVSTGIGVVCLVVAVLMMIAGLAGAFMSKNSCERRCLPRVYKMIGAVCHCRVPNGWEQAEEP